jgi:PTS system mannose-specific IIA component
MIGIVLVTHGRLGEEMVQTLYGVLGPVAGLEAVSGSYGDPKAVESEIRRTVERVVLVLTDMLGDTATNLSLAVARTSRAEVVAGVNMPMLVKAVSARGTMRLRELAGFIREYGRDHIFWASERGRPADGATR